MSCIDRQTILEGIELAGRTCYKSEDRISSDSASKFIKILISRGHESVLEHENISVRFVCDRGVSHELVRHRLASFSQESTRYCNYGKDEDGITFIIPPFFHENGDDVRSDDEITWLKAMEFAEHSYLSLLEEGWTPQQARAVLPNSLKTEIVVTANIREWRTIFKQRTSIAAHPQMRELMLPLLRELTNALPELFCDITVDDASQVLGEYNNSIPEKKKQKLKTRQKYGDK
jgi:thymidylate synthase (FAD)